MDRVLQQPVPGKEGSVTGCVGTDSTLTAIKSITKKTPASQGGRYTVISCLYKDICIIQTETTVLLNIKIVRIINIKMLSYIKTLRMEYKHNLDLEKAHSEVTARQVKPIFKN